MEKGVDDLHRSLKGTLEDFFRAKIDDYDSFVTELQDCYNKVTLDEFKIEVRTILKKHFSEKDSEFLGNSILEHIRVGPDFGK
ncbi:MAG: hypothetical protein ACFFDB_12250 [Promethearchaeota archaeon]